MKHFFPHAPLDCYLLGGSGGNSKTFVKDLQGIVGDEDTAEGREKSVELRKELLLQVKV